MLIRGAFYEIRTIIDPVEDENGNIINFKGTLGPYQYSFLKTFSKGHNLTFVKTKNGEQMGVNLGNNTYNGAIGLLQRNEADFDYIAHGRVVAHEIVDYTPAAGGIKGKIGHWPVLGTSNLTILDTVVVFSPQVWLLILSAIILFWIMLRLYSKRSKLHYNICLIINVLSFFIDQGNADKLRFANLYLSILLIVSSFLLMEIFENSVHTESVANDYSNVYESINDIGKLKFKEIPGFVKDDPFTLYIQNHPEPKLRNLYNQKDKVVMAIDPSALMSVRNSDHVVVIGNAHIVAAIGKLACSRNKDRKYYIPNEHFIDLPLASALTKHGPAELMDILKLKMERAAGVGIPSGLWTIGTNNGLATLGASPVCNCERLDELYDDIDTDVRIGFVSMKSTLVVYFSALITVSLVFFVESIAHKLKDKI